MYGSEIRNVIEQFDIKSFKGVCTLDSVPKLSPSDWVIANVTSEHHWTYLHLNSIIDGDQHFEFFDPLGYHDNPEELMKNSIKHGFFAYNQSQVQPSTSTICGLYCIYFAIIRAENQDLTFTDICNYCFTTEPEINEKRVLNFFSKNKINM